MRSDGCEALEQLEGDGAITVDQVRARSPAECDSETFVHSHAIIYKVD